MKSFIKRFTFGALLAAVLNFAVPARGAEVTVLGTGAANTVSNIVSGSVLLRSLYWINSSTNDATLKFYDTSNTSTTRVAAAYTSYTTYTTNWSVVFTNAESLLVTNTFSGIYSAAVSNGASTNERPYLYTTIVPAGEAVNLPLLNLEVSRGIAVLPSQAGTYVLKYSRQ